MSTPPSARIAAALVLTALAGRAGAQGAPEPGEPGIAARHPGDAGIAGDPDVLFVEDFEAPSLDILARRWDHVRARETLKLVADTPDGATGTRSLQVTHVGGQGTGGGLYRRMPDGAGGYGHDRVYLRSYVKFDRDCAPVHHFGTSLGGYAPATRWPQGGAGERPDGARRFSASAEPNGARWVWDFYCYWNEMRGSPPHGRTWGNSFIRDDTLKVARDRWICVELMVGLNEVGKRDGELALWLDGKPVSHLRPAAPRGTWTYDKFTPGSKRPGVAWDPQRDRGVPIAGDRPFEGFRWRTDPALKINWIWTYVYITAAAKDHVSRVRFDQIVAARRYIGPIRPAR